MQNVFFWIILLALLILLSIGALVYFFWSTQKILLRNKVSWSAKQMPLKRKEKQSGPSLLKEIESQSEEYLNSQRDN
tara:strand:- start:926 stop:1156 length:231 start_codon:yes stop_codon:yes gene_type:complete